MFGTVLKLLLLKDLKTTFRQRKLLITEIILLFIVVPGFIGLNIFVLNLERKMEEKYESAPPNSTVISQTLNISRFFNDDKRTTTTLLPKLNNTKKTILSETVNANKRLTNDDDDDDDNDDPESLMDDDEEYVLESMIDEGDENDYSYYTNQKHHWKNLKRLIKVNISFSSDIDQNLKAEYEKILKKSCKQSIFIVTNNKTIEPNITLDITKLRDFNLNDPKNASFEYKLILHDINNKGWHNEPHMIPDLFGISEPQLKHPFSQSMHAAFTQFCADYAYLNLTVPKPLSPPPRFFFKLIKEPAHVDVSYLHYCLMRLMEVLIPVLISIPTLITAHELCEEKENNVHTYMVIMGLDRSLCILSHLIVALIKMYLYILPIGITMVICYKKIGWYMFILLFLYSHVFISAIFLISSLTKKTTVVIFAIFGIIGVSFLLSRFIKFTIFNILPTAFISFFIPQMAFEYGLDHLEKILFYHQPLNFFSAPIYLPFCVPVFALLLQAISLLLLAFYFDAVIPIDDSPKKHPLFFIGKKYDSITESVKENALQSIIEENSKQQSGFNEAYFENDKNEMQADIDVIHLSKKWPNGRFGIQDVTFKAYQNQVTAILGHNGAGKSTTFSILSGLTKSTCGKAYVCGQEPRTLSDNPNVGFCPQWDALFPHLTIREHLSFYQLLKGIDDPDEIEAMIQKLGLNDYLHYRSKYLSSGIRRKLCIGMAMVANSKVIILDEPTHGMDTLSRKQLIEIIRAAKAEHTVLLATHYMDEADAVSDRIIILSNGKVICNGSSNFLKTKVGTGFLLTVDFTNVLEPESYHDYAEAVLTIVAKNCKEAKLEGVIHQQFAILLPQGSQRLFPLIFDDLEFQRDALQINCFDIHESTLEQVFIKVTDEVETEKPRKADDTIKDLNEKSSETYSTFGLFAFQIIALLIRKFHYTRRHYIRCIFPCLTVVAFSSYLLFIMYHHEHWQKDESTAISRFPHMTIGITENDSSNAYVAVKNVSHVKVVLNPSNTESALANLFYNEHPLAFEIWLNRRNTIGIGYRNGFPNGVPIAVNAISNALFKSVLKLKDDVIKTTISIESAFNYNKFEFMHYEVYLHLSFLFVFPIAFMVSIYLHVEEVGQGIVHLYQRTQMSLFSYWFASFIFDYIFAMIPIITEIIIVLAFGGGYLIFYHCWFTGLCGIFLTALVFLFQSHVFSMFFKSPSLAVIIFFVYNVLFVTIIIISLDALRHVVRADLVVYVSLFFPLGALYMLLQSTEHRCDDSYFTFCVGDVNNHKDTQNPPCIGTAFGIIIFNIAFYLTVLIIWNLRQKIFSCQPSPTALTPYKENEDVLEEKRKIERLGPNAFQIFCFDLRKSYSGLTAVRDITMGIAKSECFGLLGANGAGKSTFFNMLTATMKPTCGTGYIGGVDIRNQPLFGFCPQTSRFVPELTVNETLYFFARLKGIALKEEFLGIIIESFYLNNIKDTPVGNLTGGEHRRLNIAIALITCSDIIMLDEPTTGVDPRTRRHLWELLIALRTTGSSQLLTSHSMEECEALCTKIGFINHGVFIGIGTSQHLKNRFGNAHRLTIIINKPNEVLAEQLNYEIQTIFNATPISVSGNIPVLVWSVPKSTDSLSQLYTRLIQFVDAQPKLESGENPIKDFLIVGTSLEDVFATMVDAKIQYEFRF